MKPVRRILLPVEFTPACQKARDHAVALASLHGAELHILHVQLLHAGQSTLAGIPDVAGLEREVADANAAQLATFIKGVEGNIVTAIERDISAGPSILRYAEKHGIDLIVLGTHARKNISRLFMGSVAAEVVRHATVPVLVIGPKGGKTPGVYRRILAPQDFSEPALDALRQAGAMARQHDGTLSVLHAVDPDALPPYFNFVFSDATRALARRLLEERVAAADLGIPAETIVSVGPPDRCIADHANDHAEELVVVGQSGQSALDRFLLGSTAERVLRRAPCPVLVHCGPEVLAI